MHEAALIRRIVARAEAEAGDAQVVALHLSIGAFAQESPRHLRDHFAVATAGTPLEGAQLVVDRSDEPSLDVRLTAIDVEDR